MSETIEMLQKEAKWCEDNREKHPTESIIRFEDGFIKGIEQSIKLIKESDGRNGQTKRI